VFSSSGETKADLKELVEAMKVHFVPDLRYVVANCVSFVSQAVVDVEEIMLRDQKPQAVIGYYS
jgi:hypothetical protein